MARTALATVVALLLLCACEDGEQKCYSIEECPAFSGAQLQVCCTSAKCIYSVPADGTGGSTTFECNAVFPGCDSKRTEAYEYCGIVVVDAGPPVDGGHVPGALALTSIKPASFFITSAQVGLLLKGDGFAPDTQVFFNENQLTFELRSATEATVTIPSGSLTNSGLYPVRLQSPLGAQSEVQQLQLSNLPTPTLVSLTPNTALMGSNDLDVNVVFDDFSLVPDAYVNVDAIGQLAPLRRGPNFLAVRVPAGNLGFENTLTFTLVNPSPQGPVTSAPFPFTVVTTGSPIPTVSSVDPTEVSTAVTTVTVTGTGFESGASVRFLEHLLPAALQSDTQLQATLTPADVLVGGPYSLFVVNPPNSGGGGASFPVNLEVSAPIPMPSLTEAVPAELPLQLFSTPLTLQGTNLGRATRVRLGNVDGGALDLGFCDGDGTTGTCTVYVPATALLVPRVLTVTADNQGTSSNGLNVEVR